MPYDIFEFLIVDPWLSCSTPSKRKGRCGRWCYIRIFGFCPCSKRCHWSPFHGM